MRSVLATDPKWEKLSATLRRSAEHGSRIARSLSRTEGATNLDSLLDHSELLTRDFLARTGGPSIGIFRAVPDGLTLPGFRGHWERVFVNLFLNSARMMPTGGTIAVTARSANGRILIQIDDTGPGIPTEILPRLFEPGASSTPGHEGLGLHIVHTIVTGFNGVITAQNRPPSGARFEISVASPPA